MITVLFLLVLTCGVNLGFISHAILAADRDAREFSDVAPTRGYRVLVTATQALFTISLAVFGTTFVITLFELVVG